MKALLLSAAALLAFAGTSLAQNLPPQYDWEVGLNGGLSVMTRPLGPAIGYQGTRTNIVHDYSVRVNWHLHEHWFVAFDLGDRKWESFGNWTPYTLNGRPLKSREISFLEASNAISESFQLNYNIPFYTRFHTFNRSNLYFGVTLGLVTTMNDGSLGYSKYNALPDSGYTYVSNYHYGYGIGFSYGLQMGYTYYIIPRLGLHVELAARYAGVATHTTQYAGENANYHLLYFPETVGIRWRF